MKTLLIVYHSMTGGMQERGDRGTDGAGADDRY